MRKKEPKTEKKTGSKKKFIIGAAVVIILAAAAINGGGKSGSAPGPGSASEVSTEADAATIPEYTNVSNDEYARDGKACVSYRVAVSADLDDDALLSVFNDVCADDGYYLHTVFYYSNVDAADGGDAYDVAVLEETEPGSAPDITRK